jgi:hypothetical protein
MLTSYRAFIDLGASMASIDPKEALLRLRAGDHYQYIRLEETLVDLWRGMDQREQALLVKDALVRDPDLLDTSPAGCSDELRMLLLLAGGAFDMEPMQPGLLERTFNPQSL